MTKIAQFRNYFWGRHRNSVINLWLVNFGPITINSTPTPIRHLLHIKFLMNFNHRIWGFCPKTTNFAMALRNMKFGESANSNLPNLRLNLGILIPGFDSSIYPCIFPQFLCKNFVKQFANELFPTSCQTVCL